MDFLYSPPGAARTANRDLSCADPSTWARTYAGFVAEIRREFRQNMPSFDPAHGWRGCEHRVLLRNPYADIGITTSQGMASVWIAEREDPDFRIRCEWIDLLGDARRWLDTIAPGFDAISSRLGCAIVPAPVDEPRWLEAA